MCILSRDDLEDAVHVMIASFREAGCGLSHPQTMYAYQFVLSFAVGVRASGSCSQRSYPKSREWA